MIMTRIFRAVPMLAAAGLSALLSALAVVPLIDSFAVSFADGMALAAFGMINSGLGLALFTVGSRLLPPAETGLLGALDAPLAPIWVWVLFAETPSAATLIWRCDGLCRGSCPSAPQFPKWPGQGREASVMTALL